MFTYTCIKCKEEFRAKSHSEFKDSRLGICVPCAVAIITSTGSSSSNFTAIGMKDGENMERFGAGNIGRKDSPETILKKRTAALAYYEEKRKQKQVTNAEGFQV